MADNAAAPMTALLFQEPDMTRAVRSRRSRRRDDGDQATPEIENEERSESEEDTGTRKRRRGKRGGRKYSDDVQAAPEAEESKDVKDSKKSKKDSGKDSAANSAGDSKKDSDKDSKDKTEGKSDSGSDSDTADSAQQSREESGNVRRRRRRRSSSESDDGVTAPKGSTRLEAKRRRRKEGRLAGRKRQAITESEYLARRESVERTMLVREKNGLNQIAVLEDGVLVEHYVARHTQSSMVGNVYLGRVQNVLPSMEAAFVDIGKGRNAVLYAGEVDWDAVGMAGKPRKIEDALKAGDSVLVQVTKDPIGHKGARLTGQVTLAGRHLVLVPGGSMMGISRKLPERERSRLKTILKKVVPGEHGVIVRTAAEGATEEQLKNDVERLTKAWQDISAKSKSSKNAPSLLKGEPELAVRVIRDIFNEDFKKLQVSGEDAWNTIHEYVAELSPELLDRLEKWDSDKDIFEASRVDEQLTKAFDRKVFLPSGGSLVIDRTEAMTVIDVNTGKFTGSGGTLEETVTRNNLEAAEEIVRQLRLRDIGGIVVIDFIDMVLEENRDLVLRRLIECLGRDRTRHQVAEVTSLGLVQMTRKRVGQGLVEAFSTTCEVCEGRGYITHEHPVERGETDSDNPRVNPRRQKKERKAKAAEEDPKHDEVRAALANIAAAASAKRSDDDAEGVESDSGAEPDSRGGADSSKADGKGAGSGKAEVSAANKTAGADKTGSASNEVRPKVTRRRITSSGTIRPASSSSAIMSFPAKSASAPKASEAASAASGQPEVEPKESAGTSEEPKGPKENPEGSKEE